jgi:HEAT repeat protein
LNSPGEIDELLDKLSTRSIEERVQTLFSLSKHGEAVVEPLIKQLNNPENISSWWLIAETLGNIGDKRAVEPLIEVLQNPLSFDERLSRRYTCWALGKLRDARAVGVLIGVLHDRIYDEDEDYIVDEPDYETIEAAIGALTLIDDPKAIEPILQRIFEGDIYYQGSLLTQWGEVALKPLLDALNSDNEHIRQVAASILGEFGDLRAVEPLIGRLRTDKSDEVRHSAAYALGELEDVRAFDAMLEALNDRYEQTRAYAAMGLGKLKDSRALDALEKATQDEYPLVQNSANWAIDWINNPQAGRRSGTNPNPFNI